MPRHTNEMVAMIPVPGWEAGTGAIRVGVYTGEPGAEEALPVTMEFPDHEPCVDTATARILAAALINAAAIADEAR